MKKPNLFIVGQPKSGTTALYFLLKQHPEVFMSEDKEPNYFAKDFEREIISARRKFKGTPIQTKYKNLKEYLQVFSLEENKKIAGEASTSYLFSKVAAKEIIKFNKDSKIIILLRDPLEFVISLFQEHSHNIERAKSFEEGTSLEELRKKGKYIKCGAPKSFLYYSERTKYTEQIKRYFENFPKRNILVIISEDFKKDNLKTFKRVCRFLEVDPLFLPKTKEINPSKICRFKLLRTFLDLKFILKFRKLIRKTIPKEVLTHIDILYFNIIYNKKKITISENFKNKLRKKYKKEVIKINSFLHKNSLIKKKENLVKLWGYEK